MLDIIERAKKDGKDLLEAERLRKLEETHRQEVINQVKRDIVSKLASDCTAKIFGEKNRIPVDRWLSNQNGYAQSPPIIGRHHLYFQVTLDLTNTPVNEGKLSSTFNPYKPEIKSWEQFCKLVAHADK